MNRKQRRRLSDSDREGLSKSRRLLDEFAMELKAVEEWTFAKWLPIFDKMRKDWQKLCEDYPVLNRNYIDKFKINEVEIDDEQMKRRAEVVIGMFELGSKDRRPKPIRIPEKDKLKNKRRRK